MKKRHPLKQSILLGSIVGAFGLGACEEAPVFGGDGGSDLLGTGGGSDKGSTGGVGAGGTSTDLAVQTGGLGGHGTGLGGLGGASGCAESSANADLVPANLLFVVDKSGSMNCNPPPTDPTCAAPQKVDPQESSKWEITQDALTGPAGALQTLAGQVGVSVGLIAFPLDDNCEVPAAGEVTVPIAGLTDDHLTDLTAGLSLVADGQTPLAGAAIRGLEALRRGIHDGSLKGDNYLVVMTDGAETCQPDALEILLEYVEQAKKFYGIRTYAIGAPGSEGSRELLSKLAIIGGTQRSDSCKDNPKNAGESCHIDLTESSDFEGDLGAEFRGITEATAQSCEFDIPKSAVVDRKKVNVEFTPSGGNKQLVPQDPPGPNEAQCENAEGWQYTEDGNHIVLCGQVCDDVLSDPGSKVRVVFGCKDTVVH